METLIYSVDPLRPDPSIIAQAAEVLRSGGLVAFPTETVYGLGANALDSAAVERIFTAKGRPLSDPIIVHIAALNQLETVASDVPELAYQLAEKFWPGPLTLILSRNPAISPNISASLPTVAVRIPSHPVAHALLAAAAIPVGAPSANSFSRPSATSAQHVMDDLGGRIEMILDAGAATIGVESTVLDLSRETTVILRPGGVPLESIRAVIPSVAVQPKYLDLGTNAASPGQMLKHYSPRAEMRLYKDVLDTPRMLDAAAQCLKEGRRVGVILMHDEVGAWSSLPVHIEDLGDTIEDAAANLFAALRQLDSRGVDVIFAHGCPQEGLGAALWDRLLRAAEGKIQA